MTPPAKRTRSYNSPRRARQAAATRREILESAERLFVEEGYASTTMAGLAAEAGVATKTVYLAFESKAGVLRALWNLRLRGDHDEVPVAQKEWYREALEEPDPKRQLQLNSRNSRAAKGRVAAVLQVVHTVSPLDENIAELWERIQGDYLANQRAIVESLHEKRALRQGLDVDRATDVLWTINHPNVWQLLVDERGWSPDEYERWTAECACAQLLR